mgnify:CR=1 FL=1
MGRPDYNFIANYGANKVHLEAFDNTDADTYQMGMEHSIVLIDSTLGAGTVYLPPVSEAVGKIFTVRVKTFGSGNNVTVAPFLPYTSQPDSAIYDGSGADTGLALASAGAHAVLYSDGLSWIVLGFDLDTAS